MYEVPSVPTRAAPGSTLGQIQVGARSPLVFIGWFHGIEGLLTPLALVYGASVHVRSSTCTSIYRCLNQDFVQSRSNIELHKHPDALD